MNCWNIVRPLSSLLELIFKHQSLPLCLCWWKDGGANPIWCGYKSHRHFGFSRVFKEIASIYGVKSEIEWLKNTVEAIKAVLADADEKQQNNQLIIQLWINNVPKTSVKKSMFIFC
ncbi:hypothetical protein K1719_039128 [Acacia pycnantha]|nr:hypothetical protein K1719_039128 [Acacia pycnantha]